MMALAADPTKGNTAKVLAIFILGIGSLFVGLLPATISERNRRRYPLIISILLCFGAGVLLATSVVHMLPDVREEMPKYAEVVFCCGFFIIYFIDELVHLFFGEAIQHRSRSSSQGSLHSHHSHTRPNYGADRETESLLNTNAGHHHAQDPDACSHGDPSAPICHVSHEEPCTENMTGTFGLLCALSLHAFIEGLAIGVQDSSNKVMILLVAVACHKYVMGFCLGLELCANATSTLRSHLLAILVFSLGSAVGIGIGMIIVDLPDTLTKSALPILQGLAGGTLLYVTVLEVLPREKARWHRNRRRKYAGVTQFLAVGCGFAVMTLINFYIGD